MLRSPLATERITRVDPHTGIKVIQITSYPSPSVHPMYDWPAVTPDNRRMILYSQQYTGRMAPWDIYRCDTDGLNLFQLTERPGHLGRDIHHGIPKARLSLDGERVYAAWTGEDVIYRIDMETGESERIAEFAGAVGEHLTLAGLRINRDETRAYADMRSYEHGDARLLSVDLATGEVTVVDTNATVSACFQNEPKLLLVKNFYKLETVVNPDGTRSFNTTIEHPMEFTICDEDFGNEQPLGIGPQHFAHSTLLGQSGFIQGTGHFPHHCIWLADTSTAADGKPAEVYKLCEGPYFWHSGASFDDGPGGRAEWIISDTNWPDQGLHLIHVPTGHFAYVCTPGASQDHSQFGHPHPALSADGSIAVFTSDRTGVTQVYVALLTEEFREKVRTGEAMSGPKWME
jgi:oligogalacturonide lyase